MPAKLLPCSAHAVLSIAIAGLIGGAAVTIVASTARGQTPAAKAPAARAPTSSAHETRRPVSEATKPPFDSVAQRAFLQRDDWQEMIHDLNDWFTVQSLYNPKEVKRFKDRLAGGIEKMSAEDLQRFMLGMQEKLVILRGEDAKEASDYLSELQTLASPAYLAKMRAKLPDILSMTPQQVAVRLAGMSSKQRTETSVQKSFNEARQQRVATVQAQARARKEEQGVDHGMAASAATAAQPGNYIISRDYYPTSIWSFNTGSDGYTGVTWSLGR